MSDGRRSFWSSVPGLITGLAGLLTGIVGVVTLLIQQGIVGDSSTSSTQAPTGAVTTTVPTAAGSTTVPSTAEQVTISVSPKTLAFGPTDPKVKSVTVQNTSRSPITVPQPTKIGTDEARFSVTLGTCANPVPPNLSCTLNVTFSPTGPLRSYNDAKLQILPAGNARGEEVVLTGSTLLG